jgi:hypothetical protein
VIIKEEEDYRRDEKRNKGKSLLVSLYEREKLGGA